MNFESVIFDVGGKRAQPVEFFRKIFPNTKIYSFEPSPNIFLLKVDVEGHEMKILQGALETFDKRVIKNIRLECHPDDLRIHDEAEIERLLAKHEFRKAASIRHSIGNIY